MCLVEHPSGRYTIGDRTPGLSFGDEGSLEIVLSHDESPATATGREPLDSGLRGRVRVDAPPLPAGRRGCRRHVGLPADRARRITD
jgi:hypothetical protein